MKEKVLVIAAHPDDELIGCGGALLRHQAHGDGIKLVFLADGCSSRPSSELEQEINAREAIARKVAERLGALEPSFLRLPDNQCDSMTLLKVVQLVESAISDYSPTCIYTHHRSDLNVDHRVANAAVMTIFRPQPNAQAATILSFETASSTGWDADGSGHFRPNRYVDISPWADEKLELLKLYASEMREYPHARSLGAIQALAMSRGASVGLNHAEAFVVEREILR